MKTMRDPWKIDNYGPRQIGEEKIDRGRYAFQNLNITKSNNWFVVILICF
jgi:hypothetical protein